MSNADSPSPILAVRVPRAYRASIDDIRKESAEIIGFPVQLSTAVRGLLVYALERFVSFESERDDIIETMKRVESEIQIAFPGGLPVALKDGAIRPGRPRKDGAPR